MAITKVEGIVISETNYSESSKIINIITKEYGIIGVLAKGARSMKSKLRASTTKMTYAIFHINYKKDALSILTAVDIISYYKNIITNIDKISYASYVLDLSKQVLKQSSDLNIFPLIVSSMKKIDENIDPELIVYILELKLLDFLGVSPNLSSCSICGSNNNIITVNIESNGYICNNCYRQEKLYSDKMVKVIRLFYYIDLDKIESLTISDQTKKELQEFIDSYYEHYTGLFLKSKKFINNLKRLG